MNSSRQCADPQRWARLRFAIIGPLLAAPPKPGELQAALEQLALQHWQHPVSGLPVKFGFSTLQRWYYAARKAADPVGMLRRRRRNDAGQTRRLCLALRERVRAQYREHPGWSVQLHYDNLAAAAAEDPSLGAMPSYATLRRYFKAQGLHRRRTPKRDTPGALAAEQRLESREVRSFEVAHPFALWHLDFHHGSRKVLTACGQWVKPLLLAIIDDHSRLICHLQWYLDETAETLVHGFSQALQKRGLPRALMTDNGAAMVAEEFRQGLHALSIVHETTLPYSPYQNAKQERFWATLEGRLMAMLEGVAELDLEQLNRVTQAWVEQEYHHTRHAEIATTPLRRFLDHLGVGRACPDSATLRRAFRCTVQRRQRRSDGTFTLAGKRFEIPGQYRHLEQVHVAYARWDLRAVEMIDPQTLAPLCAVYPLDKAANADARRRRFAAAQTAEPAAAKPVETGLPALLRQYLREYAASGRPPAYLPKSSATEASST
ncbi:MAG: DDE-type integrase/transposase/recombinase [Thiohalocapsa sp.]|jgi:transposase InsO family protein